MYYLVSKSTLCQSKTQPKNQFPLFTQTTIPFLSAQPSIHPTNKNFIFYHKKYSPRCSKPTLERRFKQSRPLENWKRLAVSNNGVARPVSPPYQSWAGRVFSPPPPCYHSLGRCADTFFPLGWPAMGRGEGKNRVTVSRAREKSTMLCQDICT